MNQEINMLDKKRYMGRWWREVAWWRKAIVVLLLVATEKTVVGVAEPLHGERLRVPGDRLVHGSTVLVSVSAEHVSALDSALPFPFANVTLPEQHLAVYRGVGSTLTHQLAAMHSLPLKNLRTSAVQCVERPLKVKLVNDFEVQCLEAGVAMLVSLTNVNVINGKYYGTLVVHHYTGGTAFDTNLPLPLAALNPFLWANDPPREVGNFRGTAVCLGKGTAMQVVEGWPVRVQQFKEGPWSVRVLIEKAFVTPSYNKKQHLLHAELKLLKVPRGVEFVYGPQPTKIPFAGYVTLPSKYHGVEAALIRERLVGKSCQLRRVEPKSIVELKCDELTDRSVASLNKLYNERPPLLRAAKGAGIVMGMSFGAFFSYAFLDMLRSVKGFKPFGDPEGCIGLGAAALILSILALVFETPKLAFQYWRWRRKYNRKALRVAEKAVTSELNNPTTKSCFLDLVLVIPPVPYQSGGAAERARNKAQKQECTNLASLIRARAAVAAFKMLPFEAEELNALGIAEPLKETVNPKDAGLRVDSDGKEILSPHLSPSGIYEALSGSARLLVEELLRMSADPAFALRLLNFQHICRNLWQQWAELSGRLNVAYSSFEQVMEIIPLMTWVKIYEKLTAAGALLESAEFEPRVKEKLLGIQEEQMETLQQLVKGRIEHDARELVQLISNCDSAHGAKTSELEKQTENLKAAVEKVGLPQAMLQPLLRAIAKCMEGSQSEVVELEPLEDSQPEAEGLRQMTALQQSGANVVVEDDSERITTVSLDDV